MIFAETRTMTNVEDNKRKVGVHSEILFVKCIFPAALPVKDFFLERDALPASWVSDWKL